MVTRARPPRCSRKSPVRRDAAAIPEGVLDTLADMSYEELGIVGSVAQSLIDSRVTLGGRGIIF